MNTKELIKRFKQEFSLSKDYECELNQDDGGKTLDVMVPQSEARNARKNLPRRWKKFRVLVMYRPEKQIEEDDWLL